MNPFSLLSRLGLRWQLFLIVLVGATPIVALMLYDASADRRHEAWEIERDAQEIAVDAAWQHEQLLDQGRQMLSLLAQQDEIASGDVAACTALLATVLQRSSSYTNIAVADLSGDTTCSALPSSTTINVSDRPYFQMAYSTRDFAVGTYLVGRASGKANLPFAYPVTDASGRVQQIILAGLDTSWLGEFAAGSRLPYDADLSVLDRNGAVLAHYPEVHAQGNDRDIIERVFVDSVGPIGEGTATTRDEHGVERYYAFVPLRGGAGDAIAYFGVSFPEEEAFAGINRTLRRNVGGLMIVALLALLASWRVSERLITRPTKGLTAAATKLAAGDLQARSGLRHGQGEMGQLAASFDQMANALEGRQQALEAALRHTQLILDSAGEGILGLDVQANVTFMNPAASQMLGWAPGELAGKPAHDTIHCSREDRSTYPAEDCPVLASLRDGTVHRGQDETYWRKDGTPLPVDWTSTPVRDERGHIAGAVVTFMDVTERQRAEGELKQRYHELSALQQVSEVVATSLNVRVVAATAAEAVLWVLDLDGGIIRYIDPKTQELVLLADHGLPEAMARDVRAEPRMPRGQGLVGAVANTGQTLTLSDVSHDPRVLRQSLKEAGFSSFIGVPLKIQNEVVGVFSGFSRVERMFSQGDIALASSIGNVVGMAIANAHLFEKVEDLGRDWECTFNTMGEGVAIMGKDFRIQRANSSLAKMVNTTSQALVGQRCYEALHSPEGPIPQCPGARCMVEKRPCELVRREPTLGDRWLHLRCDPVLGPDGEIVSIVHTFSDVTEVKRAEARLLAAETRYRTLFDESPDGVLIVGQDGKAIDFNETAYRQLGYTREEFAKLSIGDWEAVQTPEEIQATIALVLREGRADFAAVHRTKRGDLRNVLVTTKTMEVDGQVVFHTLFRDITWLKQAEQELLKLRQAVGNSNDVVFMTDRNGTFTFVNAAFTRVYGYTAEEVVGKCTPRIIKSGLMPPEAYARFWKVLLDKQVVAGEITNRNKAGVLVPTESSANAIVDEAGNTIGFLAIQRDITERKLAEKKVQESELRYRTLAEAAHDAIFIVDPDTVLLYVNNFAASQLGSVPEEVVGKRLGQAFPPLETGPTWDGIQRVVASAEPVYVEQSTPFPGSDELWLGTWLVPLKNDRGVVEAVLGVSRDITAAKVAEEQVRASLAEKETLLKEVHHRVKNNLQVISSLLDLQAETVKDQEALRVFRETQNRVRSMSLVHERLYRSADLANIEFDEFVGTLVNNLTRSYGASAEVVAVSVNVGAVLVPVDKAVPFGLIINELVSNAFKHAFPGGRRGTLEIGFRLENGRFSLTVRDDGVGIPSTFDVSRATTLGLQLVNALTAQCRGTLEVHSNGGTEFRLTFPS